MVAAENTPENRVSAGERYAAVYEINLSRCIFCGYCEVACPFDAITMGHDYELSDYDRTDLIFTKEMLLAEPLERTPLRNEGEWEQAVSSLFFIAAIGAIAGAVGVVVLRDPFYSVLALVGHLLSLAVLFLLLRAEFVAAVQVVVYAGAVMVLYVFVVAYVGGEERVDRRAAARARARSRSGLRLGGGGPRRRAARRAADRAARHGPEGDQRLRRRLRARAAHVRHARLHRQAAADALPAGVRGRLVPAADRGRRRGRARPPPGRPRGRRDARATPLDLPPADTARCRGRRQAARRAQQASTASRQGPPARTPRARGRPVSIAWYLAVSAIVFALGAVGVIVRRNPLVVLLCLELMLNGANLALVAFSRMWGNGDGQILALIVMTVAACEVCIGLGMIVAIYRRRLPIDVDELRELQG